ncbi:MAG: ketohydroxyglutarate aldolase [Sphingomonas sp.]|jgi:hypothetical protein|nr:ketohydroxyglutarate aldolase [Sphingomonas sp.]
MAGQKRWVVTLSGHRSLAEIQADLRHAGLKIEQTLEAIGVITGTASSEAVSKLRRLEGVESVEEEQEIDIGPPDAPSW